MGVTIARLNLAHPDAPPGASFDEVHCLESDSWIYTVVVPDRGTVRLGEITFLQRVLWRTELNFDIDWTAFRAAHPEMYPQKQLTGAK